MNYITNKWQLLVIILTARIIELVKGIEAKQKWLFKISSRYDRKRRIAELKKSIRAGAVPLDDIELAAFHAI